MQFSNGAPGVCLGVGPGNNGPTDHKSQGFNFSLPFDGGETAVHEPGFFFCSKCHSMFKQQDFGSGDDFGPCAKGGQHDRTDSINFVLSHDTPMVNGQDKWFVCANCHAVFFGPGCEPEMLGARHVEPRSRSRHVSGLQFAAR